MKSLTSAGKKLKQIAGALGVLQGTAWAVMSLLYINFHYKGRKQLSVNSFMDEVEAFIYMLFVSGDGFPGQVLKPDVFTGFMWTYLFLDALWVFSSFYLLIRTNSKVATSIELWVFITSLVSLLDVILVILLGVDYQKCLDLGQIEDGAVCVNGILPVLTIAAKGFILWIINVIFVYILVKMYKKLKQEPIVQPVEPPNFRASIFSPTPIPHVNPQRPPNGYPQYYQYPPSPAPPAAPVQQSDYARMQRQMQSNYPYQQPFVLDSPPRRPR